MELQESRILITGGSKGLGKATAKLLIEKGAKVAITGRGIDALEKTASEIGALAIQADVAKEADRLATFDKLEKQWGGLDVLINNAGFGFPATLDEITPEAFEQVYATNVFGATFMAQKAVKYFKEQGSGHIVNIASTAAIKGYARGSIYSSSKFALRSLTQCWQAELRPHNIRVILVNPSEVPTAFNNNGVEKPEMPNKLSPQEIAHTIVATLAMDNRGFIPEVSVFATNPW